MASIVSQSTSKYLEIILGDVLRVTQLQVGAGGWHEILVSFDRSSRLVMKVVRMLPGIVRNEKGSVKNKAGCIIDPAMRGDGAMTSLVNRGISDGNANTTGNSLLHGRESRDPPSILLANTNKSPTDPTSPSSERADRVALARPRMVQ